MNRRNFISSLKALSIIIIEVILLFVVEKENSTNVGPTQ